MKRLESESKLAIYLLLSKHLFDFESDVLLICAYIPPEGSSFYEKFNFEDKNGIICLESEILKIFETIGRTTPMILLGDTGYYYPHVLNTRGSDRLFYLFNGYYARQYVITLVVYTVS